ncbi:MAG: metallophosphoesterase [Dehalococcoidia bacterium]
MTVRKYLQVNDPHCSDQPPAMRTASYLDDVLAKLAAVMQLAEHLGVDRVVFTGDVFHRKNAAHTTHRTVQRVREILNGPGVPVSIVPGNHDEAHGGGLDGQPLLSLLGDHVDLLDGVCASDEHIVGVPWSNAYEREGGAQAFADALRVRARPLVFAHAPLTVAPWPFGPEAGGWIQIADVDALLPPHVRVVAHGHMHKGHPLTASEGNTGRVLYSNPGALARATIGADDFDRVPQVALITYDDRGQGAGGTVEYLPVPHRPAAEVYRVAEHTAAEARGSAASALAASLAGAGTHVVTVEAVTGLLRAMPPADGVDADDWAAGQQMAIEAVEDSST